MIWEFELLAGNYREPQSSRTNSIMYLHDAASPVNNIQVQATAGPRTLYRPLHSSATNGKFVAAHLTAIQHHQHGDDR